MLANLVTVVARLAVLAAPFMPAKAQEIWQSLGAARPFAELRWDDLAELTVAGQRVSKPSPLFPKPQAA